MDVYLTEVVRYLAGQSWQIAVLVAGVGAITFALRNRSAHVRYLLWTIVVAKCLVPPLYAVPLRVLPPTIPEGMGPTSSWPQRNNEPVAIVSPTPQDAPKPREEVAPASVTPETGAPRLSGPGWLAALWIAGAASYLMLNLLRAVRGQYWLRRTRRPLPDEVQADSERLLRTYGVRRLPRVWITESVGQPFVWGLLRGSIYVPPGFLGIESREHRGDILAHELSHVLRFDAGVNTLQVIAQGLFWFHPFVWWANQKIHREREKCCDEMAIAHRGARPKDYSTALVSTLIQAQESIRPVPSLAVAGPAKNIEERIKAMLRPGKRFYKRPSPGAVTAAVLLGLLIVPTALVLTARAQTEAAGERQEKTTAAPPPALTAKDKTIATAALFRAITDTNIEQMRLAIKQGADLEGKNKDTTIWLVDNVQSIGCTPLYVAAGVPRGNGDMIGLLLEAGANPNTRAPNGEIPLHAAARDWDISMVQMLVSAGSDVNAADKEGRTPAIAAFESGRYNMFDLMVGNGARVSTDLMSAYKGNLSRVRSLIENGKAQERFERGLTLLHAAAAGGHTETVDLLLANHLDVRSKTQEGYTALHYAVAGNHREVAELLLAKGADVNAEPGEQTPLHWAVREQHKDMVEWLLARGANPNADAFGTPLHWAVWWWDIDTALLLASHGGDIHLVTQKYPYSPLFDSVLKGNRAMAEALITKTGDTRAAKWAPFHATVMSGDRQATEELVARGADVNVKGEMGMLALHLAARKGHKDIAELLIERDADVNATSGATLWDEGMTALHGACSNGQKGVAELLIAKGADVNAKSKNGYTPLHMAVTEGYRDAAELLIARGADVNARDSYGRTSLSLAKNRDRTEIIELLREHGAKE